MKEINLLPLFPVPLYHAQTEKDYTYEAKVSNSIKTEPAIFNRVSIDNNVINHPQFENCKKICELHLSNYIANTFNCAQKFYITNSWLARSEPGEKHQEHFHPNSIVSGVLYLQCEEDAGNITFFHQSQLKKDFNFAYTFNDYNLFNSDTWNYTVSTGDILIFPGWLRHSVEENKSSKDRIVLGFNSFVHGEFGINKTDYASKLVLQKT